MPRIDTPERRRDFRNSRVLRFASQADVEQVPEKLQQQLDGLDAFLTRLTAVGAWCYMIGSFHLLPNDNHSTRWAAHLFLVGGSISLITSMLDLEEAVSARASAFEVFMHAAYVAGSLIYVLATVFFVPEIASRLGWADLAGSAGFVAGSALLVIASFVNGVHGTLLASTATFIGCQLYLVGSILYLPGLGCHDTRRTATLCMVLGSLAFAVASHYPLVHHRRLQRTSTPSKASARHHRSPLPDFFMVPTSSPHHGRGPQSPHATPPSP